VTGEQSTRYVLAHQEAGRPLPPFSDDPYVDFVVMEAAVLKASLDKGKQQKAADERASARKWQQETGVKSVTAKPPEGGW
jgi:hypothetical protein